MYDDQGNTIPCETCEYLQGAVDEANEKLHKLEAQSFSDTGPSRPTPEKIEEVRRQRDGYVHEQMRHQREHLYTRQELQEAQEREWRK